MKKNSGIKLTSVVIMVVIMIILASVTLSSGMDSVKEANETKIAVEISEIKKAVAERMIQIETDSTVGMPGQKVPDISEYIYYVDDIKNSDLTEFLAGINDERIDYYRLLDSVSAAALGVASVQDDHFYIVDYYTGKVYGTVNMEAYKADQIVLP